MYLYFRMDSECDPVSRQTWRVDDSGGIASECMKVSLQWMIDHYISSYDCIRSIVRQLLFSRGNETNFFYQTFLVWHPACRLRERLLGGGPVCCPWCKGLIYTFLMKKCPDKHWRAGLCNVYHLVSSISGHHRSRHLCFDVCGFFFFFHP